jgi:hypothetical protein
MFKKLFAGSLLSAGLLAVGAVFGGDKAQDCCTDKLACCQPGSACCVGPACCQDDAKCCDLPADCCGPAGSTNPDVDSSK